MRRSSRLYNYFSLTGICNLQVRRSSHFYNYFSLTGICKLSAGEKELIDCGQLALEIFNALKDEFKVNIHTIALKFTFIVAV